MPKSLVKKVNNKAAIRSPEDSQELRLTGEKTTAVQRRAPVPQFVHTCVLDRFAVLVQEHVGWKRQTLPAAKHSQFARQFTFQIT